MITKGELQRVIRLDPSRLTFSKLAVNGRYGNIYRNIAFDGRMVREFIFCAECSTVLNKPKGSTGNLNRHWKIHIDKKKIIATAKPDPFPVKSFSIPIMPYQKHEESFENSFRLTEDKSVKQSSERYRPFSSLQDFTDIQDMDYKTGLEQKQLDSHKILDNGCKLVHPSTILISGPTGSGKTEFVKQLVLRNWFDPPISRIVWIYGEWQKVYEEVQKKFGREVEFVHNPKHYDDIYESLDPQVRNLVIFDDQMARHNAAREIVKFFTQGSHHRNLSVMYLVQNLFDKSPEHRNISLNSQYFFVFRNPRDSGQVRALGQQMLGRIQKGGGNAYEEAYSDATRNPYSYLQIDCRPETDNSLRLRAKILDTNPFVYQILDRRE